MTGGALDANQITYAAMSSIETTSSESKRAFYVYFIVTLILLGLILQPFMTTLMVAAVLTVWLRPLYLRWQRHFPNREYWLAIGLTLGTIVVVLAPLGWVITATLLQVQDVAENVAGLVAHPDKLAWLTPFFQRLADITDIPMDEIPAQMQRYMGQGAGTLMRIVGTGAKEALGATAAVGLNFFILLFAIYTFLLHTDGIIKKFKRISPLEDKLEDDLITIFQGFSRGIVLGGFATAIAQGIVAGIGYAIFGISESFFWGTVTALFSFVPFVGTALIWAPLAVSLALQDQMSMALGLAIYSIVITGSIDNFMKPWLMGKNSTLHPLLLFLSIFGGLMTIGPSGILIGPVAASFFLALAEVYERENSPQTAGAAPKPSDSQEIGQSRENSLS